MDATLNASDATIDLGEATSAASPMVNVTLNASDGRLVLPALVSSGILIPVMIALLPAAHAMADTHPESFEGAGADFWPRAIG